LTWKDLSAALGGERIGFEPAAPHQDRIERSAPHIADEASEMPRHLRVGWAIVGDRLIDGPRFAQPVDFDDIGDEAALR
jgi:hypothetical protein